MIYSRRCCRPDLGRFSQDGPVAEIFLEPTREIRRLNLDEAQIGAAISQDDFPDGASKSEFVKIVIYI